MAPWNQGFGDVSIFSLLPGISGKDDDTDKIKRTAIERINSIEGEITIYTDGSASMGSLDGGAAAVIKRGNASNFLVVENIKMKGAFYTCSYDEEVRAMEMALGWLEDHCTEPAKIITDSHSLCEAILVDNREQDLIRLRLKNLQFPLTIQWVPGHSEVPGNELADKAANDATDLEGNYAPITYGGICSHIKLETADPLYLTREQNWSTKTTQRPKRRILPAEATNVS